MQSPVTQSMLILVSVFIAALAGCSKTDSDLSPAVISGGSMEPALHGECVRSICSDCGFPVFRELEAAQRSYVCPNCGRSQDAPSQSQLSAQQVQIDATAEIHRWHIVAFERQRGSQDPPSTNGNEVSYKGVKRIVGFGDESISIREGDVFINGARLQKSLEQQKEMRILVYDSTFVPADDRLRHRNFRSNSRGWSVAGDKRPPATLIAETIPGIESDEGAELEYFHRRNFQHTGNADEAYPVEDFYIFNQLSSLRLNDVHDLYFELELRLGAETQVQLQINTGQRRLGLDLSREENFASVSTLRGETGRVDLSDADDVLVLEFSTIDAQLIVAVNGMIVLQNPDLDSAVDEYETNEREIPDAMLALSAGKGAVELNSLRIWRDVYYFDRVARGPTGQGSSAPVSEIQLEADEVYLLGDNVPVSIDSRHFASPLKRKQILGVVEWEKRGP
ncbi:MAG: S26 family signal peptidase [Planctomycetota bacterium]